MRLLYDRHLHCTVSYNTVKNDGPNMTTYVLALKAVLAWCFTVIASKRNNFVMYQHYSVFLL